MRKPCLTPEVNVLLQATIEEYSLTTQQRSGVADTLGSHRLI